MCLGSGLRDRNSSDDAFLAACKHRPGEKLSPSSIAIENALKGVRFWYLRQCATQKEEFVLRDLLITLLEPIIEKKKVTFSDIIYL